jgi:PAS domain S-box-containing protein
MAPETNQAQHKFLATTPPDISEHLAAQRALMKSDERFRLLVEGVTGCAIYMLDPEGRVTSWNAGAQWSKGYTADEIVGEHFSRFYTDEERRAGLPQQALQIATREGRYAVEGWRLRKDGSKFWANVVIDAIRDDAGQLIGFAVVSRDVSERKRNEQIKNEFVATVSHELRTPLTSIAGSLGLLDGNTSGGNLPETARRLVKIARTNCQRLVRLIDDILDIEKIEAGKVEFHMRKIDVQPLVVQAIEGNRGFADQFGVTVRLDPESTDAAVYADFDRLIQVITNLLSNAVKFSPTGGEVVVTISNMDANVRIAVRDHGPGIPKEFRALIFDKFAQADASDSRQKGGSGLGLSIAKQIVLRFGGEVGFENSPGGGTTFYVEMPQFNSESLVEREPTNDIPILICEDDPAAAFVLSDQLCHAGFAPDIANTAEEAVRAATSRRYAAILVDLQLPDKSGIALIKQLRLQWHYLNTPIVVVSANPKHGLQEEGASALNVLDWLAKPADIERLTRILKAATSTPMAAGGEVILVVEDNEKLRKLVVKQLNDLEYTVLEAEDGKAGVEILKRNQKIDLLLTDIMMPGGIRGDDLAQTATRLRPNIKIVFSSGFPVSPSKFIGNYNFLEKPYRKIELAQKIRNALRADQRCH